MPYDTAFLFLAARTGCPGYVSVQQLQPQLLSQLQLQLQLLQPQLQLLLQPQLLPQPPQPKRTMRMMMSQRQPLLFP